MNESSLKLPILLFFFFLAKVNRLIDSDYDELKCFSQKLTDGNDAESGRKEEPRGG